MSGGQQAAGDEVALHTPFSSTCPGRASGAARCAASVGQVWTWPLAAGGFHVGPTPCPSQRACGGDIIGYFCLPPAASIFEA